MCIVFDYIKKDGQFPLFLQGDSLDVLKKISDNSIDCCITSPPYWQKRQYENGGIGLEASPIEYIESLYAIIKEIKRVHGDRKRLKYSKTVVLRHFLFRIKLI